MKPVRISSELYDVTGVRYNKRTNIIWVDNTRGPWFVYDEHRIYFSKLGNNLYTIPRSSLKDEVRYQLFLKITLKSQKISFREEGFTYVQGFKHGMISFKNDISEAMFAFYFGQNIR